MGSRRGRVGGLAVLVALGVPGAALASGGPGGGGGGGGTPPPPPVKAPCASLVGQPTRPRVFAERGFMSVNWTVASCSAGQESLTLTFADSGVVTTAAGVPTGQTCVASAAAITVTLKPGESRTVTSLEPQICPSQLTNPSVHTVSAVARAGIVVLTRATDTYVTLPPA